MYLVVYLWLVSGFSPHSFHAGMGATSPSGEMWVEWAPAVVSPAEHCLCGTWVCGVAAHGALEDGSVVRLDLLVL